MISAEINTGSRWRGFQTHVESVRLRVQKFIPVGMCEVERLTFKLQNNIVRTWSYIHMRRQGAGRKACPFCFSTVSISSTCCIKSERCECLFSFKTLVDKRFGEWHVFLDNDHENGGVEACVRSTSAVRLLVLIVVIKTISIQKIRCRANIK